jgi:hypothetical protein
MDRVSEPLIDRRHLRVDFSVKIDIALCASGVLESTRPALQHTVDQGQRLEVALHALGLRSLTSQRAGDPLFSFALIEEIKRRGDRSISTSTGATTWTSENGSARLQRPDARPRNNAG